MHEHYMWKSMAHAAINTGYNRAIAIYKNQKEDIIKQINQGKTQTVQNLMEEFNNQMVIELKKEDVEEELNDYYNFIEFEVFKIIDGNYGTSSLESLRSKINDKAGKVKRLQDSMKKDIENYLDSQNFNKSIIKKLIPQNLANNSNIVDNLYGSARQFLLTALSDGNFKINLEHYKTSLRGYYKEILIERAVTNALSELGGKMSAARTASVTNEKGQEIVYDVILGKASVINTNNLDDIVKQMDIGVVSGEGVVAIEDINTVFGIQSKSWKEPWSQNTNGIKSGWMSIGSRLAYKPQGDDAHYWHAGVYNVMSNLTDVLGQRNAIFSTGTGFHWTADFLAQARANSYVFAFYWSQKAQKIVSPDVSMMPHKC